MEIFYDYLDLNIYHNKKPPTGGSSIMDIKVCYIALITLPDFKQFVQTFILLTVPATWARTR